MKGDASADAHYAKAVELLEFAARTLTDFDIATLVSHLFSGKYRYGGSETWERWDVKARAWVADPNGVAFMKEATMRVYGLALDRAVHWQTIANEYLEGAEMPDDVVCAHFGQCGILNPGEMADARANRMLHFSNYVLKSPTPRNVIDECRAFMDD